MSKLDPMRDLLRNRSATLGLALITLIVIVALIGPALAPYNPLLPLPLERLKGPSAAHFFGTDSLGRDILSRVIYGSRISLAIGLISVTISLVPGTFLGLLAGYFGGSWTVSSCGSWTCSWPFPLFCSPSSLRRFSGPASPTP